MSKSNAAETAILALIFDNTAWGTLAAAGAATDLFVSLHTADPGEAGDQSSSEIAYTGYARVSVARGAGWVVTGNSVSPAADTTFGTRSNAGTATATHFGVGTASSGAGQLIYSGTVTPNLVIAEGTTPKLTTASTITED